MATEAERKIIYTMYIELQRHWKEADAIMKANYVQPYYGGIMDDDEYEKAERQRNEAYGCARTAQQICDAVWNFYKEQYSKWDIDLALQEHEGRIGELMYDQ